MLKKLKIDQAHLFMGFIDTKHSAHLNQARTNAENLPKSSVIPTNVESKELYRKQVGYARLPPSGPKQIQAKKYLLG